MSSYDENLGDSKFLQRLIKECPELYNGALKHKWTICVPRAGTYKEEELNAFVFCSHVLIEVKATNEEDSLYKTANNKLVSIDFCTHGGNDQGGRLCVVEVYQDQLPAGSSNSDSEAETVKTEEVVNGIDIKRRSNQHVIVLFQETVVSTVSNSNQSARLLCIERPLIFEEDKPHSTPAASASPSDQDDVELDSFDSAFDYLFGSDVFIKFKLHIDGLINALALNINSTLPNQFSANAEAGINWLVSEIRTTYEKIMVIFGQAAARWQRSRPRVQSIDSERYPSPHADTKYFVDLDDRESRSRRAESFARNYDERALRSAVEIYVMFTVYRPTIRFISSLTLQDDAKVNRLTRRLGPLRLEQMANETRSELDAFAEQLPAARIALLKICNAFTSLLKVGSIKQALVALSTRPRFTEPSSAPAEPRIRSRSDEQPQQLMTTDQLLPLITYLVIKSDVPNWHAHVVFMKRLSLARDAPKFDENDFCVTTVEAALHFLTSEDSSSTLIVGSQSQMQSQSHRLSFADPLELISTPNRRPSRSSTNNSVSDVSTLTNIQLIDEELRSRGLSRSNSTHSDLEIVDSRVLDLFRAVREFDEATIDSILSSESEDESTAGENEREPTVVGDGMSAEELEHREQLLSSLCHPLCDCDRCSAIHRELELAKMRREKAEEMRRRRVQATRVRITVDTRDDHGYGLSALHVAAYYGQADAADLLIRRYGADVNAVNQNGCTSLHVACQRGNQQITLLLLYHGVDPNIADSEGNTALHFCVLYNNESCLKALLNFGDTQSSSGGDRDRDRTSSVSEESSLHGKVGLRIDAVNEAGDNVLHVCARWSYEAACRLVVDRLDVVHLGMFDVRNRRKMTPMDCACTSTLLTLLTDGIQSLRNRILEEQQARHAATKPKRVTVFNRSKSTVDNPAFGVNRRLKKVSLDASVHPRTVTVAQRPFSTHLSKYGKQMYEPPPKTPPTPPASASSSGVKKSQLETTPESQPDLSMKELANKLLRAAADGDVPLVKYYLDCGGAADELEVLNALNASRSKKLDLATFAKTPLETLMCHPLCQCDVCVSLLNIAAKRGTRLSVNSTNSDGFACLHVAAIHGHEELARFLLASGADPRAVTRNKRCTAAHLACTYNQAKVLRLLLDNNGDADAKDVNGNTPLHYCAVRGSFDCAEVLIENGATLTAVNLHGNTPLHEAVRRSQASIALILVENGADVSLRNASEQSCLSLAHNQQMRSLLVSSSSQAELRKKKSKQPERKTAVAVVAVDAESRNRSLSPETRAMLDTYVNVAQVVDDLHDAERIIAGMSDTIEVIAECALAESKRAASELDSQETGSPNPKPESESEPGQQDAAKPSSSDIVASQYRLLFDAASTTPLHSA